MRDAEKAQSGDLVVMDTPAMDWAESPNPSVLRKRLVLAPGGDPEKAQVTSLVRFEAGSTFAPHDHPGGEEIFVIAGVFSDQHGDYPAGTFLLNPEGFNHEPFSREGCDLFVRLQQYPGKNRGHVHLDTNAMAWKETGVEGVEAKLLYAEDGYPERIALVRFAPGASFPAHDHPRGEEVFVLEGSIRDESVTCSAGTWLRYGPGSSHAPFSPDGALAYVKTGHLRDPV